MNLSAKELHARREKTILAKEATYSAWRKTASITTDLNEIATILALAECNTAAAEALRAASQVSNLSTNLKEQCDALHEVLMNIKK